MNRETLSRSPSPPTIREAADSYQGSPKSDIVGASGAEGVFYSPASSIAGDDQIGAEGCPLAESFTPGDDDVICGRGKKCYSHIGNDRFRLRVLQMLDDYSKAKSKLDKSSVLSRVVDQVRQQSPTGGFVKQDTTTGRWFEVGDFLAREKTSQAFRDALHDRYKSSNLSKKKRRQEEQAKASDTFNRIARTEFEMASRIERLSQEFLGQDIMGMDYYGHDDSMVFDAAASQPSSYSFSPQLVRSVAGLSFSNRSPDINHQFFRAQNQQSQDFLTMNEGVNRNLMPNSPEEYAHLLQEIRTTQLRRQAQRQTTQAFPDPLFGSGFNEPNVMPDSMSMSAVARGPSIRQNINNNNNYQQVYRKVSQQQQAQDKVTNRMARLAEVQRMHRSLTDMPDMSENKMARMAEVQRMHRSLTDMPDMSGDPFMDRDKFRKLCNSLPNIGAESFTMPSYDVSMQDQSQPLPYVDNQEKIMINLSSSMHQNIMSLEDRKQPAVDFDPIPFENMKGLQKKRASSVAVTKKPVPYDANSSASFGGTQTMQDHRISKDLLDTLGKITDHTISDDTLYEPIPMSQHTQRQNKQFPTDMEDDSFEFGDEV